MNQHPPAIVVTRPDPDHRRLVERLAALHLRVLHCPAFHLEAIDGRELRAIFDPSGPFDLLLVTSPMAARVLIASLHHEILSNVRLVAPGKGTAGLLEQAGFGAGFPSHGGTSEAVLEIEALRSVRGLRIGICAAPGGRTLLAEELARRGARVSVLHVYRRVPLPPGRELLAQLASNVPTVVMITSLNAFEHFSAELGDTDRARWLKADFLVSSARLESACRKAGVARIQRAEGAGDEHMLAALASLLAQAGPNARD
ncbi:MAG: uroporphyrinogen-III synthase [Wenzhouxiangellaceae bacterium]|nr:uroporphyrinogen-III synthase [Wenzhouxiangellaceae bacterium]